MNAASDTEEDAHGGADFDAAHYLYTGVAEPRDRSPA
jgi:hypothetical protein